MQFPVCKDDWTLEEFAKWEEDSPCLGPLQQD